MLPPMGLAQCAIAYEILRYTWKRCAVWVNALIVTVLLVAGSFLLVGMLSEFARFALPMAGVIGWRNLVFTKVVTFIWCFASTPAVGLYYLARFAASFVSPVHQPERRRL